jgi:PhoPQ-activated pathogenicity-related protein
MPNQPLFNGRVEDDLQAYTFSQYIKSGDESWPLLFPMVKSVVRAMDAIQELSFKERKQPINRFVIAGHSKRGHATWLTAAADDRVKGIIPIAIDVLNSTAQLPHHLEVFGEYSTPSADATRLLEQLKLPRGRRLIEMIDPYSYREHLAVPKLVISATNDDFFPTDALNLYWRGLTGPKWILYLSNADHVRADSDPRINFTAFAFVRAVAANRSLPEVRWELKETPVLLQLRVITDASARKAGIWLANAKTRDFRKSEWGQKPMLQKDAGKMGIKENRREFEITVKRPAEGFSIFYGEIEFVVDGHVFLLTTQTFVAAKS